MKIAYALLVHDRPDLVARLATRLTDAGGIVAIHFDAKAGHRAAGEVIAAMPRNAESVLWAKPVSVGWGEWSMIEATLNCVRSIFEAGHEPDYIHLMSGADYPIRPLDEFHAFLERHAGTDFLECRDMASNRWVVDGLTHERYRYRHFFNWKRHPHLFDWNWKIQRALRIRNRLPKDLKPHMGSQWCTLTGASWKKILELARRPEIIRAFRYSWIPDEMFIQTLLATAAPRTSERCMTLYQFTDHGVPVVYCNDHGPYLARQPFFFARKISPHAARLRDELDSMVSGQTPLPSYTDGEISQRTAQYEAFRQARRQAQPGRRTVGHVADAWYGDLEWNRDPYVAFLGASREELEWVSRNLPRGSRFARHGALFAEDEIAFMDDAARFAGYRRSDTALRDHKRTNFLADVIQSSPGKITTFALPWKSDGHIRDVVRYDKQAYVVVVRGNVMRALLEAEHPRYWEAVKMRTAAPAANLLTIDEFRDFNAGYEQYYADRWTELVQSGAKWIEIDLLSLGWRRQLGDFLARIDAGAREKTINLGYPLAGSPAIHAALPDPAGAVSGIAEFYGRITNPDRRSNHLDLLLKRIARPYVVLIGASREELKFVSTLLNGTGIFACHGALFDPGRIEFLGGASQLAGFDAAGIVRRDEDQAGFLSAVMQSSGEKYLGFTIEWLSHPAFFERIARDINAKILVIHGNQLRSFLEYGGFGGNGAAEPASIAGDAGKFEEFSRAHDRYFTGLLSHLKNASAGSHEIDLLAPDFMDELTEFINGIDDRLAKAIASSSAVAIHEASASLSDPAAILSNAGYLYRRIVDRERRKIHMCAHRRGDVSAATPVDFIRPSRVRSSDA